MAQVVTHASAAFHQLHLLLVYAHDGTVRIGFAIEAYDKTVAQRCHLMVIADTCHRTACRHHVAEMVQQFEHLFCTDRILIFLLYTCHFVGDTPVHICRRLLIDIAKAILHGVFVHPNAGSELITAEIGQGSAIGFLVRVSCLIVHPFYN